MLSARDTLDPGLNWSADTPIGEWHGIWSDDALEGSPHRVSKLYLQDLGLSRLLPAQLSALTNLKELYLHDNELVGRIPSQLGGLSKLTYLYLNNNDLRSEIPPELGNLTSLKRLMLHSNNLTGSIPRSSAT